MSGNEKIKKKPYRLHYGMSAKLETSLLERKSDAKKNETTKRTKTYLALPLARCSLERVDLSCSTLIVARVFKLAGDKVPSNLLMLPVTLGATDL